MDFACNILSLCRRRNNMVYIQLFVMCIITAAVEATTGPSHFFNFGPNHGDAEMPIVDDGSSGPINIPTGLPFFGANETALYVNTNGVLSFVSAMTSHSPSPFPRNGNPIIVPFWANVDLTKNDGQIYYRKCDRLSDAGLMYHLTGLTRGSGLGATRFNADWCFVATWYDVTMYGGDSTTPRNTFQVAIATDGTLTFAYFNFGGISWTHGTSGNPTPAAVGFDAGDGLNYYYVKGSGDDVDVRLLANKQFIFRIDPVNMVQVGSRGNAMAVNAGNHSEGNTTDGDHHHEVENFAAGKLEGNLHVNLILIFCYTCVIKFIVNVRLII